jgi:hypothetical protein
VVAEATRKRHHILKFLLRRGRIYREGAQWTQKHRVWLQRQVWEDWKDELSLLELVTGLRELEARQTRLQAEVVAAEGPSTSR